MKIYTIKVNKNRGIPKFSFFNFRFFQIFHKTNFTGSMDCMLKKRIHGLPIDLLCRVSYFLVVPKYGYMEELVHQVLLEWVTLRATWRRCENCQQNQQNHPEKDVPEMIPDSKRIITRILVHREMASRIGEPVFRLPQ
jgi:hypothetical protein